jgi:tripartite-type tricarboxylate transporter receptor subunit TctC
MTKLTLVLAAACLGLQLGISQVAFAQGAYPSRPITIINPFPPGGTSEIVTRPLAAALEPIVKQPVVIETKAGAAGAVGAQFVATAAPDGYTLLSHITSLSGFAEVDKLFGRKPKFTRADFVRAFHCGSDGHHCQSAAAVQNAERIYFNHAKDFCRR